MQIVFGWDFLKRGTSLSMFEVFPVPTTLNNFMCDPAEGVQLLIPNITFCKMNQL